MRIISGQFGGRRIKTVSGPGYRPATDKVRQAVFSMLESRGVDWEECRVLDLFAGSGSLGLEALSRGSKEVWFVELRRQAAALIAENARVLGVDPQRYRVLGRDVRTILRKAPWEPFDVVFVDPPYRKGLLEPALQGLLEAGWVEAGGFVAAEVEADVRPDPSRPAGLELLVEKTYGQTRMCLWQVRSTARPCTREPSTP